MTTTEIGYSTREPAGEPVGDVLEALRRVAELLADAPRPPNTVRVQAAGVAIELEWHHRPQPLPHPVQAAAAPVPAAVPVPAAPAAATPAPEPLSTVDHFHAPTVGVFYRSPEPGAKPFVEVGDVVVPGQQVALIEAMKLMIPMEADRHGRIVQVLRDNGAAVEYGEPLFALEPIDEA